MESLHVCTGLSKYIKSPVKKASIRLIFEFRRNSDPILYSNIGSWIQSAPTEIKDDYIHIFKVQIDLSGRHSLSHIDM